MPGIVERFLDAIASHDWDVVGECIADDIVRMGPYSDRFAGRDDYMDFIVDTMPKLAGYAMDIDRVTTRVIGARSPNSPKRSSSTGSRCAPPKCWSSRSMGTAGSCGSTSSFRPRRDKRSDVSNQGR